MMMMIKLGSSFRALNDPCSSSLKDPLDTVVVQMNSITIWPDNDGAVLGMFVKSNRGRPYRNGTWFKLNKY